MQNNQESVVLANGKVIHTGKQWETENVSLLTSLLAPTIVPRQFN